VIQVLSKRLYRLTKESQLATDNLAYVVEENVLAHRDIRLHDAAIGQAGRFDVLSHSLRRLSMKSTVAYAGMSAITQVLAAIALSAVISIALWQTSESTTSVGGFVAFVTAMLLLIAPIKSLSDATTPITRGLAALERGLDLMELTQDESSGSFVKEKAQGNIEFSNVSVSYQTDTGVSPALQSFSLSIHAGENVALVGASGSGKTTLVNLLPRFVDVSSGSVSLDGVDLRDWDLQALRRQIAYVSQAVVMLNGSIAENIALGAEIDRARVLHALEAANLGDYVSSQPQGIDAMVGHNATQLSGGQRQRMAIARAIYKDAPVLILDEATSALDTASEQSVKNALKRLMQGRTTLIVAHRLSTIEHADRIVVMNKGTIVEMGSHAYLSSHPGHYASMLQSGRNTKTDL
jgi:subfamily B ATP-binding cassette protein MsbA